MTLARWATADTGPFRFGGGQAGLVASGVQGLPAPARWDAWLATLFPRYVSRGFAPRHVEFWEWVWSIQNGLRPRPFVGIWPRGGAKSTSGELATVALGARGERRYAVYVRYSQEQADKSITNIAGLLEAETFGRHYPDHGRRRTGKYGSSRGWRRERLWTAGGFVVDGLGLDVAMRGIKVEEQRPDLIILDDIDERHDTPASTKKKVELITDTILPAGSSDAAVLFLQNLIIPDGVAAQLADRRADFLADRVVSGPHPALLGMRTEPRPHPETGRALNVIVSGAPTWQGQDLAACQDLMNSIGLRAFKRECQHEVRDEETLAFAEFREELHVRATDAPPTWPVAAGMDWGFSSPGYVWLAAFGPEDRVHGRAGYRFQRKHPRRVGQETGRWLLRERLPIPQYIVLDSAAWATGDGKGGRTKSIAEHIQHGLERVLGKQAPPLIPSTKGEGSRRTRKLAMNDLLAWSANPDGTVPEWGRPRLTLHPDCEYLIRTLPNLPLDPKDAELVDTEADDHAFDAATYLLVTRTPEPPKRERVREENRSEGIARYIPRDDDDGRRFSRRNYARDE